MNDTPEQTAIYEWGATGTGHAIIVANAGSGKSTTLRKLLSKMSGSAAAMAYNKAMADEFSAKLSGLAKLKTRVKTVHAFGFEALRAGIEGIPSRPDGDKLLTLAGGIKTRGAFAVARAVSLAKQYGIGIPGVAAPAWEDLFDHFGLAPVGSEESFIERCEKVLKESNERVKEFIDFDDMIYAPLFLGVQFQGFDVVAVDEAQDISPLRLELALRMLKPTGRFVAVGDPNQAIYGFTGADSRSMEKIQKRLGAASFPLSVTWRCPRLVVEAVQSIVPAIRAREGAPDGIVRDINFLEFDLMVRPGDMVLCRLNRPLVTAALKFIREGRKARIQGKDIGKGLLTLAGRRKWGNLEELVTNLGEIEDFEREKCIKADSRRATAAFERVLDNIETLRVLIERGQETRNTTPPRFAQMVEGLFSDDKDQGDAIDLSSVHKSKGLERERVFILHRYDLMPFPRAELPWEIEQEYNLIYVAETRSMSELYRVNREID